MRHLLRSSLVVLLVVLAPGLSLAQGVAIDHKAIGCVVAGKYPTFDACFTPAADLARGRVYFRAEGTGDWFFVQMNPKQPCFQGVLPRPKKSLKALQYYIESVGKNYEEQRSAEFTAQVVDSAGACQKDKAVAPFLNSASVVVGGPAGLTPFGFAAGGAGLGTAAIVGIVAAAGAGTAGVVAASKEETTTTSTTTSTTSSTTSTSTSSSSTTTRPANRPPTQFCLVNPTKGDPPLTVTFRQCGSRDPDGDELRFDFFWGDGEQQIGSCQEQHTYPRPGLYNLRGCVTDKIPGHQVCCEQTVNTQTNPCLGDTGAPSVSITSPEDDTGWDPYYGPLTVAASASDPSGIASVSFYERNDYLEAPPELIGTDVSAPYSVAWSMPSCFFGKLFAKAMDNCGNEATSALVYVYDFGCGSAPGPGVFSLRWASQLDVPGSRGQVVVNGGTLVAAQRGRSEARAEARRGDNRIEAQLVEASGKPGLWRFDFSAEPGFVLGSLKVVTGQVVQLTGTAVAFRLAGQPGERIVFTFRTGE